MSDREHRLLKDHCCSFGWLHFKMAAALHLSTLLFQTNQSWVVVYSCDQSCYYGSIHSTIENTSEHDSTNALPFLQTNQRLLTQRKHCELANCLFKLLPEPYLSEPGASTANSINTSVMFEKEDTTYEVISKGFRHPISAASEAVCG